MKRLFLTLCITFLGCNLLFSQNKVYKDHFSIETPGSSCLINYSYHYYTNDEGKRIPNGSISANLPQKRYTNFNQLKEDLTYNFSGNYKDGLLNGPLIINQSYVGRSYNWLGKQTAQAITKHHLSGNFINGVPNGKWNVSSENGNISLTFKNAMIVGSFKCKDTSCSNPSDNVDLSGQFNMNGEMDGLWKVKNGESATFSNGILVDYQGGYMDMNSNIKTLSKKFVLGQVSEEALEKQQIIVTVDSTSIYQNIYNVILSDQLIDWSILNSGWKVVENYTSAKKCYYKKLEEALFLKDEALEWITKQIREDQIEINNIFNDLNNCNFYSYNDFIEENPNFFIGRIEKDHYETKVYLTKSQSSVVRKVCIEEIAKLQKEQAKNTAERTLNDLQSESYKIFDAIDRKDKILNRIDYQNKLKGFIKDNESYIEKSNDYYSSVEDYKEFLANYSPIKAYNITEIKVYNNPKDSTLLGSTEYTVNVRLKIQHPGEKYGYDEIEFPICVCFPSKTTLSYYIMEKSFDLTKVKYIPNKWGEVTELENSLNHGIDKFKNLNVPNSSELLNQFNDYMVAHPYERFVDENVTISSINDYLKRIDEIINCINLHENGIKNLKNLNAPNSSELLKQFNAQNDITTIYNKAIENVDETIINIKKYISEIDKFIQYVNIHEDIITKHNECLEYIAESKKLKKLYTQWYSSISLAWNSEEDNLQKIVEINNCEDSLKKIITNNEIKSLDKAIKKNKITSLTDFILKLTE